MSKSKNLSKAARDNRANQLNPTHPAYHRSRGASPSRANDKAKSSKPVRDNRSNQLNPNNRSTDGASDSSSKSSE